MVLRRRKSYSVSCKHGLKVRTAVVDRWQQRNSRFIPGASTSDTISRSQINTAVSRPPVDTNTRSSLVHRTLVTWEEWPPYWRPRAPRCLGDKKGQLYYCFLERCFKVITITRQPRTDWNQQYVIRHIISNSPIQGTQRASQNQSHRRWPASCSP